VDGVRSTRHHNRQPRFEPGRGAPYRTAATTGWGAEGGSRARRRSVSAAETSSKTAGVMGTRGCQERGCGCESGPRQASGAPSLSGGRPPRDAAQECARKRPLCACWGRGDGKRRDASTAQAEAENKRMTELSKGCVQGLCPRAVSTGWRETTQCERLQ
jgi:hypothetical protein